MTKLQRAIGAIASATVTLTGASKKLATIGDQMGTAADAAANQAGAVSLAAEEVSGNVSSVAAGTEEITGMAVSTRYWSARPNRRTAS